MRERRRNGGGLAVASGSMCCAASDSVCCVASESVCCVWTSDTVIERRLKGVVHLGRDTEFEWRQSRTKKEVTE